MSGKRKLCAAFLAGLLVAPWASPQKNPQADVLLRAAIHKEVVEGKLEEAIQLYRKILEQPGVVRAVAAKAWFQLGRCHEKLGKAEARKAYERVLGEYSDQREIAAEARARLAVLRPNGGNPAASGIGSAIVARQAGKPPDLPFISGGISPDGRYLSYVDWETGNLAVFELATGAKRLVTNEGSWQDSAVHALYSKFSADGRQIAYTWFNKDGMWELRIVGADGSGQKVLYRSKEITYVEPGGWSPDGQHLAAILTRKDRTNQIALISVQDGSARALKTLDWRYPRGLGFSPDGRYILYDFPPKEDSPQRDIFLLAADGSQETLLVEHPSHDLHPLWLPDGKRVFFPSDRTGTLDGWAIHVAGGKPQGSPALVKPDIGRMAPIGFTRAGLFYYGLQTGIADVYVATLDLQAGKVVEAPAPVSPRFVGSHRFPEWSPDGQYLAYSTRRDPTDSLPPILTIRSLKTGQEQELPHGLNYLLPGMRWSPDGRFLLATGSDEKRRQGLYRIDVQTGETTTMVHDPIQNSHGRVVPRWNDGFLLRGRARQQQPPGCSSGTRHRARAGGLQRRAHPKICDRARRPAPGLRR